MTRTALVSDIHDDLRRRTSWETKQGDLYKARFRGLRRSSPPWPNASDINWPLIDGIVEKLKPHYLQQLYANELLASFVPAVPDADVLKRCNQAAAWFDFELKQNSNLERSILHTIDAQLMLGRPAMKVIWSGDKLDFTTIAPDKLIVPDHTEDIDEADRVVHVMTFSVARYRLMAEDGWLQGDELIESITGSGTGDAQSTGGESVNTASLRRTGITEGDDGEIVAWEVWERKRDCWCRSTFSPLRPDVDLRPEVEHDLEEGHPFVDFPNEITQPNWYSPRGIGEIVLPFQAQLTKLLNEKNDAMTLSNRPMFRAERDGADSNFRMRPGQILPVGISPVPMPSPPIQFDIHINLMRQVAEALVGTPDFGMAREGDMRKARTATEMEQIASMNAQSGDLRMRVFRMSLGRLYRKAWAVLSKFAKGARKYWREEMVEEVGADVVSSKYTVKPSGSADGVTRQRLWQKAVARLQMFGQDPFIDQGELRKSVLESDDAGLVRRLYRDPGMAQATQAEDQGVEIGVMRIGLPATVTSADDHAVHIRTLLQYVAQQQQTGQPPTPLEMQQIQTHLAAHVQALHQTDPAMARQAMDAIETLGASMGGGDQQREVA